MIRQLTLRLCVLLCVATMGSTASACCLFPFLNPFAWTCGHGCGYGQGGYGYAAAQPWGGPARGSYGYGGRSYAGRPSWGGSAYTPSYPMTGSATDCECATSSYSSNGFPATAGSSWPNTGMAAYTSAMSPTAGWSPQRQWAPQATSWQAQPPMVSMTAPTSGFAAPQIAMSTAPVYGPAWEVPGPTPQPAAHMIGDIRGDHEIPVIPNSFHPMAGPPVHPASYRPRFPAAYRPQYPSGYRPRPRTVRQWYHGVVR